MKEIEASAMPAGAVLADLRGRYPDSPLLALGQTVFWDEPMKAVVRSLLDANGLGGKMVVGVHDTDYFAKARLTQPGRGRFRLMPHNDGTTRDLWSAAGEISTLFGSETFPARTQLVENGVAFSTVVGVSGQDRQAVIDRVTEAWGWRGLVYTGSRDLIVASLALRDVGDAILRMLEWGFRNALEQIVPGCCQDEAERASTSIGGWCRDFIAANPERTLSDLFQHVLPKLYALLLGGPPNGVEVTATSKLLRFNPSSASLPRFKFVDLFLNPTTRAIAEAAYDEAVAGSEIYTLDRFGTGALPFDLVIPDWGRGTLRVTERVLFIETRQPIAIGLKKPIESVHELAEVLCRRLGDNVTLVGKAVSLISMLAQEFIFVFNEEGSGYVWRTRKMNDTLVRAGVTLDMRPILRLRYNTWDSLDVGVSTLRLPAHLAAAFGRATITTPEFASSWRQVVKEQRDLCERLRSVHKPMELLRSIQERDPSGRWDALAAERALATERLLALRAVAEQIQTRVRALYTDLRELRAQSRSVQNERGAHYRSTVEWTPDEIACREVFGARLRELERRKAELRAEALLLRDERRAIERGDEALRARATRDCVDRDAETARLELVRSALLVIQGLPHTNHRPSAWWLPMVDAVGNWFRRIVETTEAYTEPLLNA